MKRILFITNIPSPYRVKFFDLLGKSQDVTVLFFDRSEDHRDRMKEWYIEGDGGFQFVQLSRRIGSLCVDVIEWIKKPFDVIVVCGYSSPTAMLAIAYMKLHRIPFYMEVDGGLIRKDSAVKFLLKKCMVGAASAWLSSGKATTQYLLHYGAVKDCIMEYPFSSLMADDILPQPLTYEEKCNLRNELGIIDKKMVLSIGQFIPRKGFDILINAAKLISPDIGIYIVGGQPTAEYLQQVKTLGLKNIHFVGFLKKEKLEQYYIAADLFVLPTREDIWGLVVNESMAYGLPVITTEKCVAGMELIEDGVNGYIVPVEDEKALADRINKVLQSDLDQMGAASLSAIRPYTIENMVKTHIEIFENRR